ncbi:MAG: SPFH domain-containing protein [Aquificota bacterium]|nr:SPFH domain-containing protein [Aquificota bacterium]
MDLEPPRYPRTPQFPKGPIAVVLALVVLGGLLLLSNPFVIIPSGYVGVKLTLGKASPEEMKPGLHLIIPFLQRVERMSVRTHSYDLTGANSINALSKDRPVHKRLADCPLSNHACRSASLRGLVRRCRRPLRLGARMMKPVIRSAVRDAVAGPLMLPGMPGEATRPCGRGMEARSGELAKVGATCLAPR